MRTVLLSCFTFLICTQLLLAQNDRPRQGRQHPSFVKPENNPGRGQIKEVFHSLFDLKEKDGMHFTDRFKDDLGYVHETYQQYYDGVKVEGGAYRVHLKDDQIESLSGHFMDIFEDIQVSAAISPASAFNRALNHVNANRYIWDDGGEVPEPELVIIADPNGIEPPRLAYKFDIYATAPLYRAYVYLDAQNGQFIQENPRIHHANVNATGVSLYNGTVTFTADQTTSGYRLRQTKDGNGIRTFDMNNGTSYSAATDITSSASHFTSDDTGVQAHWGSEQTYQYYLQKHGRQSFDGNGATLNSYVHYGSNYINAFWDGQRMTYGDGDGVNYLPLVSLDIVGHEITHGVIDYAANLVYSYESGALNESFADIFGEAIERFATGTNDWLLAAEIKVTGSEAIRSMSNPKAFGDPDTYKGSYWYSGTGDNGGVHTNSGVQNKWFYILSEGESGTNDLGNSYSVTGIGFDKAAAIAYRNLTVYLSVYSEYADARTGSIQAAIDLYGEGSVEVTAVKDAWFAVGVGEADGGTAYCDSKGKSAYYEWIAQVKVGSFTNTSGSAGYTDFTSKTIQVSAGQTYDLTLQPGFLGAAFNEYWKMWIDYNADGDFDDAGELVFDPGGLNNATVTGVLTIPTNVSGNTRLRVSMKFEGPASPCEIFNYGEVEDYTLSIDGNTDSPDSDPPSPPTNLTASNITQTSVQLDWGPSTDNVGVTGYKIYKDDLYQGTTNTTTYTVLGLAAAITYKMAVVAIDAAGNTSSPAIKFVTTEAEESDSEPPSPPTNLIASNITQTSAQLNWDAATDNVGVAGYKVYVDAIYQGTTNNTSFPVNGLAPGTSYQMSVVAEDAAGNSSSAAATTVTTQSEDDNPLYCSSKSNNANDEWIKEVKIGDLTHASGSSMYSDFTAMVVNLTAGQSYQIKLTPGFKGTHYNEYWRIWIDYTQDGDFDDAEELVFDPGNSSTSPLTGTITIPEGVSGDTRIRISMKYNNPPSPCETFTYGEVEDYTASISADGGETDNVPPTVPNDLIALNITENSTDLFWKASDDNVGVVAYHIYIDGDWHGQTASTQYAVNSLIPGTTYNMAVSAKDAAGNESGTNTISVTTLSENEGAITLFGHYFETGWDGWTDGGSDCHRYRGVYSWEGEYSIRLRDDFGPASTMTSESYDITSRNQLELEFYFYAMSMENSEGFRVSYYDGSQWQTLAHLRSGTDFANGSFYLVNATFNEGIFNFPSDARFRFQCDASSNYDQIFIDAITVRVNSYNGTLSPEKTLSVQLLEAITGPVEEGPNFTGPKELTTIREDLAIKVFPNPAFDVLQVQLSPLTERLWIHSLSGVLLNDLPAGEGTMQLDIRHLPPGMYYLSVQTSNGLITKKFVKQ